MTLSLLQLSSAADYWNVNLSSSDVEYIKQKIKEQKVIRGIHLTSWVSGDEKKKE